MEIHWVGDPLVSGSTGFPGTSTTGAFLFDSEHAGGDVVEVGETVLALRSKRTIHDPPDGDHAVHMLEIPQDSCAY